MEFLNLKKDSKLEEIQEALQSILSNGEKLNDFLIAMLRAQFERNEKMSFVPKGMDNIDFLINPTVPAGAKDFKRQYGVAVDMVAFSMLQELLLVAYKFGQLTEKTVNDIISLLKFFARKRYHALLPLLVVYLEKESVTLDRRWNEKILKEMLKAITENMKSGITPEDIFCGERKEVWENFLKTYPNLSRNVFDYFLEHTPSIFADMIPVFLAYLSTGAFIFKRNEIRESLTRMRKSLSLEDWKTFKESVMSELNTGANQDVVELFEDVFKEPSFTGGASGFLLI